MPFFKSPSCFSILSQASAQTELKIKEAIYINSMNSSLNQVKHVNLKLSFYFSRVLLFKFHYIINSISLYMFVNLICYSILALRQSFAETRMPRWVLGVLCVF